MAKKTPVFVSVAEKRRFEMGKLSRDDPKPEPIKAEVTVVERRMTVVKDANGNIHNFIHGSINAVRFDLRKKGQKGWIRWVKTPSMFFPTFDSVKDPFSKEFV